jgi:hypothetical protein
MRERLALGCLASGGFLFLCAFRVRIDEIPQIIAQLPASRIGLFLKALYGLFVHSDCYLPFLQEISHKPIITA